MKLTIKHLAPYLPYDLNLLEVRKGSFRNSDDIVDKVKWSTRDIAQPFIKKYGHPVIVHAVQDKATFLKILKDGKIKLQLLVDRTSIEIFINDGEYYMPIASIPNDDDKSLKVFAKGGEAKIINLDVNELKSVWR